MNNFSGLLFSDSGFGLRLRSMESGRNLLLHFVTPISFYTARVLLSMPEEWNHATTLATFMNEPEEAHAWFIGLCQTIHRVKPYRFDELVPSVGEFPDDVLDHLKREYTYYYVAFWLPRVVILAVILSLTTDIWIDEACRILLELLKRNLGIS